MDLLTATLCMGALISCIEDSNMAYSVTGEIQPMLMRLFHHATFGEDQFIELSRKEKQSGSEVCMYSSPRRSPYDTNTLIGESCEGKNRKSLNSINL